MQNNEYVKRNPNIGFCGILQLIFITLKLCNVIDWSWWWVLAPTWITLSIVILLVSIIALNILEKDVKKTIKS